MYHYTYGHKVPSIIAQGLAPSPIGYWVYSADGSRVRQVAPREQPVLWFSTHPRFEPTAKKPRMVKGRMEQAPYEQDAQELGLYRFVPPAHLVSILLPFYQLRKQAGFSYTETKRMVNRGLQQGAQPDQWFGLIMAAEQRLPVQDFWLEQMFFADGAYRWEHATFEQALARTTEAVARTISVNPGVAA